MDKIHSKLVLIGGGGHCASVVDSAIQTGRFDEIVITDKDFKSVSDRWDQNVYVYGDDGTLPELYRKGFKYAAITVGQVKSSQLRRTIYENSKDIGFEYVDIIDTSSVIGKGVSLGSGVYIGKKCVINTKAGIGDFSIINTGAIIEHDCRIGSFCHVAVGAVICGGTDIGDDVLVGANATVIQGVKIGDRSVIGAGSVVLTDVPADITVVGVWKGHKGD